MGSDVIHQDLELYLTDWYRAALAERPEEYCKDFTVANAEPGPNEPFPDRLLVVRFDGMTPTSAVTAEASVGVSVLAGSKVNPKDANDAALMVLALSSRIPSPEPSNPVAALLSSTGPIAVAEAQDRARRYLTLTLAVAGRPF